MIINVDLNHDLTSFAYVRLKKVRYCLTREIYQKGFEVITSSKGSTKEWCQQRHMAYKVHTDVTCGW